MRLGLLGLFPLVLPALVQGQVLVRGLVVSDSTRLPLAGAEILVEGTKTSVLSTGKGRFELGGLPAGRMRLLIRHVGYRPQVRVVTLAAVDTLDLLFRLQATAQSLDPIVVEAPAPVLSPGLREMEQRRRLGLGQFVTTAQLRDLEGRRSLIELLRRLGVNFEREARTGRVFPTSPRGPTEMSLKSCRMQVVLDWAPIDIELAAVPISSLGGVEVYKGISETPLIFERGTDAACGVIVLWTRER
jgi:hypothetical protein